jgi:hypothetical protein
MKLCPQFNHQYRDEALDFCPDDGDALLSASEFAGADTMEMEPEEMLGGASDEEGSQE